MAFKRLKKIAEDISSDKEKLIKALENNKLWEKKSENEYYSDIIEFDLDLSDYEIYFISGSPLNDTDGLDSRNAGLGIETIELEEIDLTLNENSVQISFYYYGTRQYDITYGEALDFVVEKDITNGEMFDEMSEIFVDNYDWPDEY